MLSAIAEMTNALIMLANSCILQLFNYSNFLVRMRIRLQLLANQNVTRALRVRQALDTRMIHALYEIIYALYETIYLLYIK